MPEKWNKRWYKWNKEKKLVPLEGGTRKKLVPLFSPSRSTPKMPINLIKSKPYKLSGTSGTTGTNILRNTCGLGEFSYFYKSKGISRKVRSICSTVPPHKKSARKGKDGMRGNTRYNYNNLRNRVGIGDADAGGYKAGTLQHEEATT